MGLAGTGTGQVGGTHPKPVSMPQVRQVVCPSGHGLSCILSKGDGGCWKKMAPSVLHFEQGRGGGWLEGNGPLHLAFQVREGRGLEGNGPLRLALRVREALEGGGWKEMAPSVSHFEQGRFTRRTCVSINII